MEIVSLGHASFLIKGKDISFVLDPYQDKSVPHLTMPRVEANYVFKSHDHYDHNALDLVKIVPSKSTLFYNEIVVPHDHHNGAKRGLNTMRLFKVDGYTILHMGDLGCIPSEEVLKQIENVDVVLGPINGFFTISAEELYDICNIIRPKLVIPMHYFRREDESGYPDGGQINRFKEIFPDILEVNDFKVVLDDSLFAYKALIFNKSLQE